jgi:hypothetical protein
MVIALHLSSLIIVWFLNLTYSRPPSYLDPPIPLASLLSPSDNLFLNIVSNTLAPYFSFVSHARIFIS